MLRILITGGAGQVGTELRRLSWPEGWIVLCPDRETLDLADPGGVHVALNRIRPDAIINTAAYTAVDRAESEVEAAWALNATAPALLAAYARQTDILLIQVSTDYVFGPGEGYRAEDALTAPTSVYGASKRAGELAVLAASNRAVVVRTAWVVSPWRQNFVKTMLRLAQDRDELTVVGDQRGCPSIAADLADALQSIAIQSLSHEGPGTGSRIVHFVNAGEATWAELAAETMLLAERNGLPSARVREIRTAEFPTPVRRPVDSRLDTSRLTAEFGITPRPWRAALVEVVAAIAKYGDKIT